MPENTDKKKENMWGCWFMFDNNTNLFFIEINDIIYTVSSKQFREIVYTINTFYGKIINNKVMDTISNFVQQDGLPEIENVSHKDSSTPVIVADDASAAISLWENMLHGGEEYKNGKSKW